MRGQSLSVKKMVFAVLLWIGVLLLAGEDVACAGEDTSDADNIQKESMEEILQAFDFEGLDEAVEALFPEERMDFEEMLAEVLSGEGESFGQLLKRLVSDQFLYAVRSCRENLLHILFLAVMAAVFMNFGNVFQNKQISQVSFYIIYLLMIALCLNSFRVVVEWTSDGVENLTTFMGVFCPLYFLAVTIAKGSVTAMAFYHLALLLIFLVELLIVKILLPLIHIYMMTKILNFLSEEGYLSKFSELIETVISWSLKTLLGCVIGLNVLQSLISPAIDTVKRSTVARSAEAIPGIGDMLGGMTEVIFGTAVLVKNGIGMTGAIICFALCIYPLVQVGCIVLMYQLAAALIQPISDKRIIGCMESVGEGCRLLMRIVFTSGLLFLLTIVIVSASTSSV